MYDKIVNLCFFLKNYFLSQSGHPFFNTHSRR